MNMFRIGLIILKKKKYALVAGAVALAVSGLSYYLTVVNVFEKSIFIYAEMNGVLFTIITILLGLAVAILFGLSSALLVLRRDIIKAGAGSGRAAGLGGAIFGLLASGCPSCGAPLLGLVGLPLGLFSLPFKGIELKLVGVAFLLLSVKLIEKNIEKNLICQIAPEPML